MNRLGVFIDGPNLYSAARGLGMQLDFGKLLEHFDPNFAVYVTALNPDGAHDPVVKLTDYLAYNGYRVVTKPAKVVEGRTKGNMDIELALEIIQQIDHLDEFVIFTGDGDFAPLVKFLHARGKLVTTVCSSSHTADDLRRVVDDFIPLESLRDQLSRPEAANG